MPRKVQRKTDEAGVEAEAGSEAVINSLNLRSGTAAASTIDPSVKRFDMFLIDTGWNRPVSEVVRRHLPVLYEYQRQDALYILTSEQSVEVLRREPTLIGHDPTLLVYDLYAGTEGAAGRFRGFRIHLGRYRNGEHAMARLQEFLRFVNMNRTAERLDRAVRAELHREGFSGAVKILRDASAASIEMI